VDLLHQLAGVDLATNPFSLAWKEQTSFFVYCYAASVSPHYIHRDFESYIQYIVILTGAQEFWLTLQNKNNLAMNV
jgi:hypothetical protein